jgi:hypothetical protein
MRQGKVVITTEDHQWEQGLQGYIYYYLHAQMADDTALNKWWVFAHEIRSHSGEHQHQGGLIIYVVEGSGYSMVDGVREDWEAGDLLLLPLKPGGVAHQHFNNNPGSPCQWVAFIYIPIMEALISAITQLQVSPDWKGR